MADLNFTVTALRGKPVEINISGLMARIKQIQLDRIADVADLILERIPDRSPTYTRTETLERSFYPIDRDSDNVIATSLGNSAEDEYGRHYSSFVLGDSRGRQARVHEGRWLTAREAARETLAKYRQDVREALRDAIR